MNLMYMCIQTRSTGTRFKCCWLQRREWSCQCTCTTSDARKIKMMMLLFKCGVVNSDLN